MFYFRWQIVHLAIGDRAFFNWGRSKIQFYYVPKEEKMFFIGVDLGTSAVKLLLMDENGKIHKIVSKEYPLYFPHPAGLSRDRRTGSNRVWRDLRNLRQSVIKARCGASVSADRCTAWWRWIRMTVSSVRRSSGMTEERESRLSI